MIRGVNFGNWLVLERWMSPELFSDTEAEDEVWLYRLNQGEALNKKIKEHRDTYITDQDFKEVAQRGLNLIRIPVPYFIFGDVKPFVGAIEYLDKAFEWASKYQLKILIDLHTVPGSQNGYDNGGITGVCKWHKDPKAVEFALHVLERLAERYANHSALYGIEVLNEPISWIVYVTAPSTGKAHDKGEAKGSGYVPMKFLKNFYIEAYQRIRNYLPEDKVIVFHDGFRLSRWGDFFKKNNMKNVVLDTHMYLFAMEMYVPFRSYWIYQLFMAYNRWSIKRAAKHVPVVVGEWCLEQRWAIKQAKKKAKNNEEYEQLVRDGYQTIANLQLSTWELSAGWIYWSYQLYRDKDKSINDQVSMDAWALTRVWKHQWMPQLNK